MRDIPFVEMVESPQRDWWVVLDGRVMAVYLAESENGFDSDAWDAASDHADRLRGKYGCSILGHGTTWRSRAFDHLEDLSCRRSTCCRFIPRSGPVDWEEGVVAWGYEGGDDHGENG